MSTKEKTGSAGRTAGILFILLALAAVAVLGVYIYRQLQPPKAPETAIGYVASETAEGSGVNAFVVVLCHADVGSGDIALAPWPQTWRRPVRTAASAWSTARGTSCWTRPIWPMISAGRYRWRRCTPCGA